MGAVGGAEMPMLTAQENGGLSETLLATSIKYMGGVIKNENMHAFRRSIFRQTRGKTFVHTFDLDLAPGDQLRGDPFDQGRHTFVLAFQEGHLMEERIRRCCNAYADVQQCDVVEVNLASLGDEILQSEGKKQDLKDFIKNTAI